VGADGRIHKSHPKRTKPRNTHGEVSANTAGALAMLAAANRELDIFRTVYPEIDSRSLTRLGIALDCVRRSLVEADNLAGTASREVHEAARRAGDRSSQVRGSKIRKLIAAFVDRLLSNNVPRRGWIDWISPRLPKRHRLGDPAIQKHLRALGYSGRQKRN